MSFGDVIEYWVSNQEFRSFYNSLFTTSGLSSYVWETPPITINHLTRTFEFVLISSPIRSGSPDHATYSKYFNLKEGDDGVVAFDNLGKDALLVVPSPYRPEVDYSDFAAFFRRHYVPAGEASESSKGSASGMEHAGPHEPAVVPEAEPATVYRAESPGLETPDLRPQTEQG